jgi:hypothetical protein
MVPIWNLCSKTMVTLNYDTSTQLQGSSQL